MKTTTSFLVQWLIAFVIILGVCAAAESEDQPAPGYHIYAGNTHAHTSYTWSHGDQWFKQKPKDGKRQSAVEVQADGVQHPKQELVLRPVWKNHQGPPSAHYKIAKACGYDFYVATDHSQESTFQPVSPTNATWMAAGREAAAATDKNFVALRGYEHSENNGPNGKGHLNVINSAEYLNALAKGVDLPRLYDWLKTVPPNGEGPVVASFNHPGRDQYNDWAYRDPQITEIITLLEVINSNNKIHYDGFVRALDKGWKVSPVCGNDNHGFWGIRNYTSRTFVLATNLTKPGILEAMKHRRTYASLDTNLRCEYYVNGAVMGSTLDKPSVFNFEITVSDPDTAKPADKITKLDIVTDHGAVAETYQPTPAYSIRWSPTLNSTTSRYYFVRVWNAGGGDARDPKPSKPVAWLAPVWTGR
ncbi:MAG TPA: hypothetical protein VHH88_03370 [Verrucomicrobiae bacterium]|nr:hypothetical protein [Verrucomicrobiae bacterium]